VDRHEIWRRVRYDQEQLSKNAPEGFEAVVDVYLAGREHPVELGWVETRRRIDDPWVRFQQYNRAFEDAEERGRTPGERFVHVHESAIFRVEVSYAPTGKRPRGFHWKENADDADPGGPRAV
jgi:hypothetical protein